MAVTLLVGAAPYRIDDRGTEFLLEWIRLWEGERGGDLDDDLRACLELADEIEASDGEPVELGHSAIEGLCAYVLRDYFVHGHEELSALYFALRRYRGDPV